MIMMVIVTNCVIIIVLTALYNVLQQLLFSCAAKAVMMQLACVMEMLMITVMVMAMIVMNLKESDLSEAYC